MPIIKKKNEYVNAGTWVLKWLKMLSPHKDDLKDLLLWFKQTNMCVWWYREFTSNENNTEKSIFASTQSFDFEEIIYQ